LGGGGLADVIGIVEATPTTTASAGRFAAATSPPSPILLALAGIDSPAVEPPAANPSAVGPRGQNVCLAATGAGVSDPEVCATSELLPPTRLGPVIRRATPSQDVNPLSRVIDALPVTGAELLLLLRAATILAAAGGLLVRLRRRVEDLPLVRMVGGR
jgi:hypothetical protein